MLWFGPGWSSDARLFRFHHSYFALPTFLETHLPTYLPTTPRFAKNSGIEKNVWTGYNYFSVRRY